MISEGSTYGGWSAFLSEAVIIRNGAMYKNTIRPDNINQRVYEGILPEDDNDYSTLLKDGLSSLISKN